MANHTPAIDLWMPSGIANYDRSIHSNPDAKAWAYFFVEVFPGLKDKHELMHGWFANAMMAMHDHIHSQPNPLSEQLATVTAQRDELLQTLTAIANISHHGALIGKSDIYDAFNEIRRLTIKHWDSAECCRLQSGAIAKCEVQNGQ